MACTATDLIENAKCIQAEMSVHQMLAAITYLMATKASVDPAPANLIELSKCISTEMSEHQMLASIAYLQCQLAGG